MQVVYIMFILYSFCHSVLSGWKDKFCKHLDKCERAQSVYNINCISLTTTYCGTARNFQREGETNADQDSEERRSYSTVQR